MISLFYNKKTLATIFILFILVVSYTHAQEKYLVSAQNGLIVRLRPDRASERIAKLSKNSIVEVIENTHLKLKLVDNNDTLNGEWVRIKFDSKINTSKVNIGYVFNGYLKPYYYNEDFIIVSGKKIGKLKKTTTKKDLIDIYGVDSIKDTLVFSYEDINVKGTIIIFSNPKNNIKVVWKDNFPESAWVEGGDWHTQKGVRIGSTLSEVETINGKPFIVNGFEIDHYIAGVVKNWVDGNLQGLGLQFEPTIDIGLEYGKIIGDLGIDSDDPVLQKAGLKVRQITIQF